MWCRVREWVGARNQDSAEIRRGEAGLDHGTAAALAVFWLELEADRLKIDARSNREARAALLSKSSTQTSQMYAYTCESCTDLLRHVECKVAAALAHVVTKPVCVACARAGRRSQHVNLRARGNLLDVCTHALTNTVGGCINACMRWHARMHANM